MSMAMPKNLNPTDVTFAAISLTGALLGAFAYTGGRVAALVPEDYFLNFFVIAFGLYGLGFVFAPKMLLEMNYQKTCDNYHEAVSRAMGSIFLWSCYSIYTRMMGANTFTFTCGLFVTTGIFGPTYNALYLDPINTPSGAPPGNVLFLIGGILAATAQ